MNPPIGKTYRLGYDLFVIHREDFPTIRTDTDIYFGEPWWDYHALLQLILHGIEVIPVESAHVLHAAHQESWSADRWEKIGIKMLNMLRPVVPKEHNYRGNLQGLNLARMLREFYHFVDDCGSTGYRRILRRLLSRPPCVIDEMFLREFSQRLRSFAEEILSFRQIDQGHLTMACLELSEALQPRNPASGNLLEKTDT
jgi:hypothetical protein